MQDIAFVLVLWWILQLSVPMSAYRNPPKVLKADYDRYKNVACSNGCANRKYYCGKFPCELKSPCKKPTALNATDKSYLLSDINLARAKAMTGRFFKPKMIPAPEGSGEVPANDPQEKPNILYEVKYDEELAFIAECVFRVDCNENYVSTLPCSGANSVKGFIKNFAGIRGREGLALIVNRLANENEDFLLVPDGMDGRHFNENPYIRTDLLSGVLLNDQMKYMGCVFVPEFHIGCVFSPYDQDIPRVWDVNAPACTNPITTGALTSLCQNPAAPSFTKPFPMGVTVGLPKLPQLPELPELPLPTKSPTLPTLKPSSTTTTTTTAPTTQIPPISPTAPTPPPKDIKPEKGNKTKEDEKIKDDKEKDHKVTEIGRRGVATRTFRGFSSNAILHSLLVIIIRVGLI